MKTIRKLITLAFAIGLFENVNAQDSIKHLSLNQACQLEVDSNINRAQS